MAMNFLVYRREKSLVHKLPALLKIALLFFISIRVFSSSEFFLFKSFDKDFLFINTAIFFRTLFYFILTVFFFICAKTPFSHLSNLLFVPVIGGFVLLFRCVDFFPLQIIFSEIPEGILYIVHFFITTLMAMIIFETTSQMEILESTEGIQRFLVKRIPLLKRWNFPLLIVLSINFIPQIFFVWEQVGLAVKARTFRKNRYNFILKLKILTAQFSGVISCMLHRTDEIRKAVVSRSWSE